MLAISFSFSNCAKFTILLASLALLGGCSGGSENARPEATRSVAIVDLDAVAKKLGRLDVMNEKIGRQGAEYDRQLDEFQAQLQASFDAKMRGFGQSPTNEQRSELALLAKQSNVRYAQAKQRAVAALRQYRTSLIAEFHEEAKPYALQIAKSRGMSMVIPKNQMLFLSYDSQLEITDAVAAAMAGAEKASAASQTNQAPISKNQPHAETPQTATAGGDTLR